MPPLISFRAVTKRFAGVVALNAVSLDIAPGEVCCLLGENGSGKSTLIKTLSGVHAPDDGEIAIKGKVHKTWSPLDAIGAGIEVIYQDFLLFPNLSVKENICLVAQLSSGKNFVDWAGMSEQARRVLTRIEADIPLDALVEELSVAQRQLVAIARALLGKPSLIVMDEPTAALTKREIDRLLSIIEELRQDGVAIIFVSHKLDEVIRVAQRVVVLRNGSKTFDGPADGLSRKDLVTHMVGREIAETRGSRPAPTDETVLEVTGLTRARYFRDISFRIRRGEILGLTGQIDSGRTALALSLYGLLPADSGTIAIEGKQVRLARIRDALGAGISMLPEDRLTEGVFLPRSVGANLAAGLWSRLTGSFGFLELSRVRDFEKHWISQLSIKTDGPEAPVSSLSGGNQQRVVLARALARNPKVVVLNGPTIGVDVGSKAEIHEIVEDLSRQGVAVLVVSDDTDELLRLADRIMIMDQGRIVREMPVDAYGGYLQEEAVSGT